MIRSMLVREWMSPAETVYPDTPFQRALAQMKSKGIRCLVVVDKGRVVGIITSGDIRHAMPSDPVTRTLWDVNRTWQKIRVADLMNPCVVTVGPGASVMTAVRLMRDHKISRVVVVDHQQRLLGMLTCYDIYRMMIAISEDEQARTESLMAALA